MQREFFEINRNRFEQCVRWGAANGIAAQYSKLRVSRLLQNGIGNYNFDITQAFTHLGEKALNRNDLFVPFGIGLYLMFDSEPRTGKAPLYSYPVLADTNRRGFLNADDIEALYHGVLTIDCDQTVLNESFPLEDFRIVPEFQGVTAKTTPQMSISETIKQLIPTYKLQGTFDTKIEVKFNAVGSVFDIAEAGQTTASTTHKPYLVFYSEGCLLKNAAEAAKLNPLAL